LRDDPDSAARFNAFMTSKAETFVPGLLRHFDFSRTRQIVDVGGGNAALLAGILQACPKARGVVLPATTSPAQASTTVVSSRERTEQELRAVIETAGFLVERVLPTEPEGTVVAFAE
jgi:hypothetical protein